jgi:hypothetical protein
VDGRGKPKAEMPMHGETPAVKAIALALHAIVKVDAKVRVDYLNAVAVMI